MRAKLGMVRYTHIKHLRVMKNIRITEEALEKLKEMKFQGKFRTYSEAIVGVVNVDSRKMGDGVVVIGRGEEPVYSNEEI